MWIVFQRATETQIDDKPYLGYRLKTANNKI